MLLPASDTMSYGCEQANNDYYNAHAYSKYVQRIYIPLVLHNHVYALVQSLQISLNILLLKHLPLAVTCSPVIYGYFIIMRNVTGSSKTLHVRVFYTSSQKQLLRPDSTTAF